MLISGKKLIYVMGPFDDNSIPKLEIIFKWNHQLLVQSISLRLCDEKEEILKSICEITKYFEFSFLVQFGYIKKNSLKIISIVRYCIQIQTNC